MSPGNGSRIHQEASSVLNPFCLGLYPGVSHPPTHTTPIYRKRRLSPQYSFLPDLCFGLCDYIIPAWVWTRSGSWWWTAKPDVLQSMGLQRIGHDWVTKLNTNLVFQKWKWSLRYSFYTLYDIPIMGASDFYHPLYVANFCFRI